MENFWFYGELGFFHVMDWNGYDHVLFLIALALPFGFHEWKRVFWLATLFTAAHCFSLALAAYGLVNFDPGLVEFLIPVTILLTAVFDLFLARPGVDPGAAFKTHLVSTGLFGLIHGLGFSNYFRMLMAGETDKTGPLFGFALGIEAAQLLVLLVVMALSYLFIDKLQVSRIWYIRVAGWLIIAVSGMLMVRAWPA